MKNGNRQKDGQCSNAKDHTRREAIGAPKRFARKMRFSFTQQAAGVPKGTVLALLVSFMVQQNARADDSWDAEALLSNWQPDCRSHFTRLERACDLCLY
jgi:hypothetical protein